MIRDPGGQEVFLFFRGRGALYHVLDALDIGSGDEVAVQAFTCLAVALPMRQLGAVPLFIDADTATLGMSVEDLRWKIGPRTRAVVVQHTFGIPADIRALKEVAEEAGAALIEDCAHVVGGSLGGKELGSFGAAAFYSYEWGKPLVAGVGGGLVVNDAELRARVVRKNSALDNPPFRQRAMLEIQYQAYRWVLAGTTYWALKGLYNSLSRRGLVVGTFRPEDFEGQENREFGWRVAPGTRRRLRRRLLKARAIARSNRALTERYERELRNANVPTWPSVSEREAILMRYPFTSNQKAELLERAQEDRVELSGTFKTVVDPVPAEQANWIGYEPGSCPEAEALAKSVVSAPVAARVSDRQIEKTVAFLARNRDLLEARK